MEQTIIAYYEAILRQTPTQSQIDQWDAFLTEADDLEDALADFAQALCLQADEVRSVLRLYQAVFDRMSDSDGLTFWTNRFREIQEANPELSYRDALIETISQWLESDEYIARFGDDLSDEDFLSLVYLNILGRPADQEGYNFWLAILKSGEMTREQLIVEFTESDEFKAAVDDEANGLLKAAAAIDSDTAVDDLPYEFPGGDPYTGELGNEAPVDILIGTDVDENAQNGDEVNEGQLTVVDPDGGETFTWSIDDPSGAFGLDDPNAQQPKIVVIDASKLDHETADVMTVTITVEDSKGNTYSEDVDIDINDVNEEPSNIQASNTAITEQDEVGAAGDLVATLSVDDPDDGDSHTFTILNQSVAGAFMIVGNELQVADPSAIDTEAGVSSIDVEVEAEDSGGLKTTKVITIDVSALFDEAPSDIFPDTLNVPATTLTGAYVADPIAFDDDAGDDHTFELISDPTGAFEFDVTEKRLKLKDASLLNAANLLDGGPMDEDGVIDGKVVVTLDVRATDMGGNTLDDTITVTVDQSGAIIPFTDQSTEVLEGTNGNDLFTASSGLSPGQPRTANPGDIANGNGGTDTFFLNRADQASGGDHFVTGVTLNGVDNIILSNRDDDSFDHEVLDLFDEICTPCFIIPDMPEDGDGLIFELSTSPDVDFISFFNSVGSVGVQDTQRDFWTKEDDGDPNDMGPVIDLTDVTGHEVLFDSDPQAKLSGEQEDELKFTINEVHVTHIRVRENSSNNEPGGPRGEQVGTMSFIAAGIPSIIGSIENGQDFFDTTGAETHTLNFYVEDLTGTSPTTGIGCDPVDALFNTNAFDLTVGHVNGLGDRLYGLEVVNIIGGGDVNMTFGTSADRDSDLDGNALTITDGAGSSFFQFEEGGFNNINIDGGDGFDTLTIYDTDLGGPYGSISGIDRLKLVSEDQSGIPGFQNGFTGVQVYLDPFGNDLQELVFASGVGNDVEIYDVPYIAEGTQDQSILCDEFGIKGFVIKIDQCCTNFAGPPSFGDLPDDFDLYIEAEEGPNGENARVDVIFNVDPDSHPGGTQFVDNLNVYNVQTLHLAIMDCDDGVNDTSGVFEVTHLGSRDSNLQTLLITDDGRAGTTRILTDNWNHDPNFPDILQNPFGSTTNLTLINGVGGVRNQEFLEFDGDPESDLKFLEVLEDWGSDINPITNRPVDLYFLTDLSKIEDELIVSDDGVKANLGNGNDIISGNRDASGSFGELGADIIAGNGGNDQIFGARGNDLISGGTGDDELRGEEGDDTIHGDEGDDLITGDSGNDNIDGGTGDDIILGGSGNDNLIGGDGDDAICGDDGDDCLLGGEGSDLLIGGAGDDFLDAGASGTDVLVGDYGCDPCYSYLSIPEVLTECDEFSIGIDWDGDGVIDDTVTHTVSDVPAEQTAAYVAEQLATDLAALIPPGLADCYDISWEGGQVVICKVDTTPPLVEFEGMDYGAPSVHKSELSGDIVDGDNGTNPSGDSFSWDITWNGGADNEVYTYTFEEEAIGTNLANLGPFDGVVDSIDEIEALAKDIAEHFNNNAPGNLLADGFSMEVDADGKICLIGPKDGETPSVSVSAADGTGIDIPAAPEIQFLDLSDLTGWEAGDQIDVSWSTLIDGPDTVSYVIELGQSLSDIVSAVLDEINNNGAGVEAEIDPDNPYRICIKSDNDGLAGAFDGNVSRVLTEDPNALTADEQIEISFTDFDAAGESFSVDISTGGNPPETFGQFFDTDLLTTLQNFIAQHGADILADHDIHVAIGGTAGSETLLLIYEPPASPDAVAADFTGNGSVQVAAAVEVDADLMGGTVGIKQPPNDDLQDMSENLVETDQTDGEPPVPFDLEVVVEKTEPGQDVFVVSARENSMEAFAVDAYDNDDLPTADFAGLLANAGLTDLGVNDAVGDDFGVSGVVYIMDFNQGGGGDDLSTWDVNESYSPIDNTNGPAGRFYSDLSEEFPGNADRLTGDKLAFRKSDDGNPETATELDVCGTAFNYDEDQNNAKDRDDADADAVNAFNANSSLRYYVNGRSFEDALEELGYTWGVDITQAIVDDALADIADDGDANNSAGGIANGAWGNASDLLGGADAVNSANIDSGILDQAKADSWLRVYYNEAGTDAAPEAVMELVGLDDVSQVSFEDIVGVDCIDDCDTSLDPFVIC